MLAEKASRYTNSNLLSKVLFPRVLHAIQHLTGFLKRRRSARQSLNSDPSIIFLSCFSFLWPLQHKANGRKPRHKKCVKRRAQYAATCCAVPSPISDITEQGLCLMAISLSLTRFCINYGEFKGLSSTVQPNTELHCVFLGISTQWSCSSGFNSIWRHRYSMTEA